MDMSVQFQSSPSCFMYVKEIFHVNGCQRQDRIFDLSFGSFYSSTECMRVGQPRNHLIHYPLRDHPLIDHNGHNLIIEN